MNFRLALLLSAIVISFLLPSTLTAAPKTNTHRIQTEENGLDKKSIINVFKIVKKSPKKYLERVLLKKQIFDLNKILKNSTGCEELILKNGEVLKIKIISLSEYVLSYVPCDNQEADEINLPLKDISLITASNGDIILKISNYPLEQKIKKLNILAIVFGLFGLWPILGILFSTISLLLVKKTRKIIEDNPELIVNEGLINFAYILGLLGFAFTFILLTIVLTDFF